MSIRSNSSRYYRSIAPLLFIAMILIIPTAAQAQDPELHVFVGDTTGPAGQQNSVITVYMDNWDDTVSAFEMWLMLDNIDIMSFQTGPVETIDTTWWKCLGGTYPDCTDSVAGEPDSTYWRCLETDPAPPYDCIDSIRVQSDEQYDMAYPPDWDYFVVDTTYPIVGSIDTVGTLIGGWEDVKTRSFSAEAIDVRITARANANFSDGINTPGVPRGQQGGVLFRLLGDIKDIDDTTTSRDVNIRVLSSPPDNFIFSRPDGSTVGLAYEQFLDTNYYWCEMWDGPDCASWVKVPYPPYDSIYVVPDSTPFVDTMRIDQGSGMPIGTVWIEHGSLTVDEPMQELCGNVNLSEDQKITLSDITRLIDRVYISKTPLDLECIGNTNCSTDGKMTLSDITTLIDHVYISKAPLCEECCSY